MRLQPLHVLGLLRQERIEHRLVLARGVEPPLDADLLDQLVEAERAADHADRADDGGCIGDDLVGRAGDHVAAGRRDILDEGDHRHLLLVGERADAPVDQMRLRRRAARRIDRQRDRADVAHGEGALQRARDTGERQAGLQRRSKCRSRRTAAPPARPGFAAKARRHQAAQRRGNSFERGGFSHRSAHSARARHASSHRVVNTSRASCRGTSDSAGALSPRTRIGDRA